MTLLHLQTSVLVDETMLSHLTQITSEHKTLENILIWRMAQTPPIRIEEMVQQDEFTSDVIIPFDQGLFLVYDVT